jgi:hypothetical protein
MRDEAAPNTSAILDVGHAGWLMLLGLLVGAVVRLIKTNAFDAFLAKFSLPPIPKKLLPWLALALGFVGASVEAKIAGASWHVAALSGLWGVFSGAFAVAGQETIPTVTRSITGSGTNVVFGPNAGPDTGPAAPNPSVRPPKGDGPQSGAGGAGNGASGTTPVGGIVMRVVLASCLAMSSVGCAALWAALPSVIAAVQAASLVLDQLQQFADTLFRAVPNAELEKRVGVALAKTRSALLALQHAADGASDLHDERLVSAFNHFESAYNELLALLRPLGVEVEPLPLAGAGSAPLQVRQEGGTLRVPPAAAFLPKEQ